MTPDSPERTEAEKQADWLAVQSRQDKFSCVDLKNAIAAALLKAREEGRAEERKRCAEIARQNEEGECLAGCNSFGHEELCPVANPRRVILAYRQRRQRAGRSR